MRFADPPALPGQPFALRPLGLADVDAWYAHLSIPGALANTSWQLDGPDDLVAAIARCGDDAQRTSARFAIVDANDGSLAGTIGLVDIGWRFRTAELGYDVHPARSGRGLATTCARAVADWLLDVHGFIRVEACALDTNVASRRVLEKAGFAHEGRMRNKKLVGGEPRDFDLFARVRPAR